MDNVDQKETDTNNANINTNPDLKFLHLCASLKPGLTIHLANSILVPINSWWYLFKRRYHQEDRNVLLKHLDLRISKILADNYVKLDQKTVPSEEIRSAMEGLRQLALTYKDDQNFKDNLSIIINKMEHFLYQVEEPEEVAPPEFLPTIRTENENTAVPITIISDGKKREVDDAVTPDGPIYQTLKRIRTWSEMQNRSRFASASPPPEQSSFLRSLSYDSLNS